MAKSELTQKIECLLHHYTKADSTGIYGAFEVCIGPGYGDEYCDYMTMDSSGEIRCYEIKVSKSDFLSKAKLSWYGDFNYFVLPRELYEQVKNHFLFGQIGAIVLDGDKLTLAKKSKRRIVPPWNRYMLAHCMVRSLSKYTTREVKEREEKYKNT